MVKKAILFFTVLFMIFGCEPTVYEGAEKVETAASRQFMKEPKRLKIRQSRVRDFLIPM